MQSENIWMIYDPNAMTKMGIDLQSEIYGCIKFHGGHNEVPPVTKTLPTKINMDRNQCIHCIYSMKIKIKV